MKSVFIAMTLFSQIALADSKLEYDIRELANVVDIGTNGGGADLGTYNSKGGFSYQPLVKDMLGRMKEYSGCSMQIAIGTKDVLSTNFAILTPEATALLKKLVRKGQVRAILGFTWDGSNGDSESCSREDLDIYFNNQEVLQINYDSTT